MNLTALQDRALLLSRVVFGGLMLNLHGAGKLEKLLAGSTKFADPLGLGPANSLFLAASAEAICAGLVVIGLATRAALIPLMCTMLVAVFITHGSDPLAKKELGLLYLTAYVVLFVFGPGRIAASSLYVNRLSGRWPAALRYLAR